jgi:oligopeptide/dipeptide ABC transporter ATP-binding protein
LRIGSDMTSVSPSEPSGSVGRTDDSFLEVRGLTVGFPTRRKVALAANDVGLALEPGKALGLVGESGCGKSVTLRTVIGMTPKPGEVLAGEIWWKGRDLLQQSAHGMREVRGREIAMISQDPGASLNPVYAVGAQISEVLRVRLGLRGGEARDRAVELLRAVGIPSPAERARAYPHQLSGGMRQRVMIAIAIAANPSLLLADEPTTALDVTVQEQILSLLLDLQRESGMGMILVSHDLGVIGQTCDDIAVMYAGYIVERGPRDSVIGAPRHPYSRALLAAELVFDASGPRARLETIRGQPPDLGDLPPGCPFQSRCPLVRAECQDVPMTLDDDASGHGCACPFWAAQ